MIYDYLISIEVKLEEAEKIFYDNIQLLGAHFKIETDFEINKMDIMMHVHEFFVSKAVKKGLKPVLLLTDVSVHFTGLFSFFMTGFS
jgi:hypothetical protein